MLWLHQEVLLLCFSSLLSFTPNAYKVAKWSIVGCLLNSCLFLGGFFGFFLFAKASTQSSSNHGLLEYYNVLPSLDLFFQLHVFKNQIFATFEKKRIRNISNSCVFISSWLFIKPYWIGKLDIGDGSQVSAQRPSPNGGAISI